MNVTLQEVELTGGYALSGVGDPNRLDVYLAVGDVETVRRWAESDDLKERMASAGVVGAPVRTWMTPVRQSIVWDRELPAMMVTHRVEDFDEWLSGYDAADVLQRSGGIVGHAANRSIDDPQVAVVYHQADSFDALRAFLQSDELRLKMKEAGVVSEPEITFHTGGWAKRYD
jgi:hypothetical protein